MVQLRNVAAVAYEHGRKQCHSHRKERSATPVLFGAENVLCVSEDATMLGAPLVALETAGELTAYAELGTWQEPRPYAREHFFGCAPTYGRCFPHSAESLGIIVNHILLPGPSHGLVTSVFHAIRVTFGP